MAASAVKAMGAASAKEKQAILEARRQRWLEEDSVPGLQRRQVKEDRSVVVGCPSESGARHHAQVESYSRLDVGAKEGASVERPDGVMEKNVGRLALQAISSMDELPGDVDAEGSIWSDGHRSDSPFEIRSYVASVREERGDLTRSWPFPPEYLQGRVPSSLLPPIEPVLRPHRNFYRGSLVDQLEDALAAEGFLEGEADLARLRPEDEVNRAGSQSKSKLDLVDGFPAAEAPSVIRPKPPKVGRRITTSSGRGLECDSQERSKRQDIDSNEKHRRDVDPRAKLVKQALPPTQVSRSSSKSGGRSPRPESEECNEQIASWGGREGEPSRQGNNNPRKVGDERTLGVVAQQSVIEQEEGSTLEAQFFCGEKAGDSGKIVTAEVDALGEENNRDGSNAPTSPPLGKPDVVELEPGEAEVEEKLASKPEAAEGNKSDGDRTVEKQRSVKSGVRPAEKRSVEDSDEDDFVSLEEEVWCPVCHAYSSMSHTTLNVHIDSCLMEQNKVNPTEYDRGKVPKPKFVGAKTKRKKRSIADIFANSSSRTLEEGPGTGGVGAGRLASRPVIEEEESPAAIRVSKNLNWMTENKKKRQPRNVPSRNFDNKRRRFTGLDPAPDESRLGRQEKRRLPEREHREGSRLKQVRLEAPTGESPSSASRPSKDSAPSQHGDVVLRRGGSRRAGLASPRSVSPSGRSVNGKANARASGKPTVEKEAKEVEVSDAAESLQLRNKSISDDEEDVPMEVVEILGQKQHERAEALVSSTTSSAKASGSTQEDQVAGMRPSATGRVGSPGSSSPTRAAKAWYPPAAMLRNMGSPGSIPAAAEIVSAPELTSGSKQSPQRSSSPGIEIEPSKAWRKSARPSNIPGSKVFKGSRVWTHASPRAGEPSSEAAELVIEPNSQRRGSEMAECKTSKEVDDYSEDRDQAEKPNHESRKENSQARIVKCDGEVSGPDSVTTLSVAAQQAELTGSVPNSETVASLPERMPEGAILPENTDRMEEMRASEDTTHKSLEAVRRGGDVAAPDMGTGTGTQQGERRAGGLGDQTMSSDAAIQEAPLKAMRRRRPRGESTAKAPLEIPSDKTRDKGKRCSKDGPSSVEGPKSKQLKLTADVSKETRLENDSTEGQLQTQMNKLDGQPNSASDILKESAEQDLRRGGREKLLEERGLTDVEPQSIVDANKENSIDQNHVTGEQLQEELSQAIQGSPAIQYAPVRRIEGIIGPKKSDEIGTLMNGDVGIEPSVSDLEKAKDLASTAPELINSPGKLQETRGSLGPERVERVSEVVLPSHQVNDNGSQVHAAAADTPQSQLPIWGILPQIPLGKKKLPVKRAARSQAAAPSRNDPNVLITQVASSTSGAVETVQGSTPNDSSVVTNTLPLPSITKPLVNRSRAARQLAKSAPGNKKKAPSHVEPPTPNVQPSGPPGTTGDPNGKGTVNSVTPAAGSPGHKVLPSPSPSYPTSPPKGSDTCSAVAGGSSITLTIPRNLAPEAGVAVSQRTEEVSVLTEKVTAPTEKSAGDSLIRALICNETLSDFTQDNSDSREREMTSLGAKAVQIKENRTITSTAAGAAVVEGTVIERAVNSVGEHSPAPEPTLSELTDRSRKVPEQSRAGIVVGEDEGKKGPEKPANSLARNNPPELGDSGMFNPAVGGAVGGAQRFSRPGVLSGKTSDSAGPGRRETTVVFQRLSAGITTFTNAVGVVGPQLADTVRPPASTTAKEISQVATLGSIGSISSAASSQMASVRPIVYTTSAGHSQLATARLATSSAGMVIPQAVAARPTICSSNPPPVSSFSSLLQSTSLPSQSSAALSLAMQGTRPLQEAGLDQNEMARVKNLNLSRAMVSSTMDIPLRKRQSDGFTWGNEKQTSAAGHDPPTSTHQPSSSVLQNIFRPPVEMGGPMKHTEAGMTPGASVGKDGDTEVSRLPGWMRAAITDQQASDSAGVPVSAESDRPSTETARSTVGPESGENCGPVRVRLWGRDVVIPPEKMPEMRVARAAQVGHGTGIQSGAETLSGSATNSATGGSLLNSPSRVSQSAEEPQASLAVTNRVGITGGSARGGYGSTSASQQAENYLSRLDANNVRAPFSAPTGREETRSSRLGKGQTSTGPGAQNAAPPEVIVIDDSVDPPVKARESLTIDALVSCGALRFLPQASSVENGRQSTQLMEVDPAKIPQRLSNKHLLAELRKIGLVPAPKTVLAAAYRQPAQSLSMDAPASTQPLTQAKSGPDLLPPWLLAEKKRKEAQIAANLIVLDDDDDPPTTSRVSEQPHQTSTTGDRGSTTAPRGGPNLSGQAFTSAQASPTTLPSSVSETWAVESRRLVGPSRPTSSLPDRMALPTSGQNSTSMPQAPQPKPRTSPSLSSHGDSNMGVTVAGQRSFDRRSEIAPLDVARTVADKDTPTASNPENMVREGDSSGVRSSSLSKGQTAVVQTSGGPHTAAPRKPRDEVRSDTEKQLQASDCQPEKRTSSRSGAGGGKPGSPASQGSGQAVGLPKRPSSQGISILPPTWMSGSNGLSKRGAAAQACKQAVERLKARILAKNPSPGDGSPTGGDFESHMIGLAQDKSTGYGVKTPNTTESGVQNLPSQPTHDGFRYSSLSSRSVVGRDISSSSSSKEAPQNGRAGAGQPPPPGSFPSSQVLLVRDGPNILSKTQGVSAGSNLGRRGSPGIQSRIGDQTFMQGTRMNSVQSGTRIVNSSAPMSGPAGQATRSNSGGQHSVGRESRSADQPLAAYAQMIRSVSSSPTARSSRDAGERNLDVILSEQASVQSVQGMNFSRPPLSRLPLPASGPITSTAPTTKTLIEQVVFQSRSPTIPYAREGSSLQASHEVPTRRAGLSPKRVQPSRRKHNPANGADVEVGKAVTGAAAPGLAPHRPSSGFQSSTGGLGRSVEAGDASLSQGIFPGSARSVGLGSSTSSTQSLALSPVFGRLSQASGAGANAIQGGTTPSSNASATTARDGGTWKPPGEAGLDAPGAGVPGRSAVSGMIPDQRMPVQIVRALGHPGRSKVITPSTNGGSLGHRGSAADHSTPASPRTRTPEGSTALAQERYPQSRISREEKRDGPKLSTADSAEKIRTKSLNSI